jgi:hypothetical protein
VVAAQRFLETILLTRSRSDGADFVGRASADFGGPLARAGQGTPWSEATPALPFASYFSSKQPGIMMSPSLNRSSGEETIMVQPEELLQVLRQRPFRPFLVHVSDGRTFEVRYPDMHIVGTTFFMLGIPETDQADPFADHFEVIDLAQIRGIEPCLDSAALGPK